MKACPSVTKQIARTVQLLNYLEDLQAYQITICYEHDGSFSTSKFILPQQFLFPFTVIEMPNLPTTQSSEIEVERQEITMLTNTALLQIADQESLVQEEAKEKAAQQKKQVDFDRFVEQNSEYMNRLRREVMKVRTQQNRKRIRT